MGDLLRVALAEGIGDRVLSRLNASYRDRAQLLCRILQSEPRIIIDTVPTGGYFLWLTFPFKVAPFLEFCKGKQSDLEAQDTVKFLPGKTCDAFHGDMNDVLSGLSQNFGESSARLCFADMDIDELETGATLLVAKFQEYMSRLES